MVKYIPISISKRLATLFAICVLGMSTMLFAQTITVYPTGAGTAELNGTTLVATSNEGYVFVGWDLDGDGYVDDTNVSLTITPDPSAIYTAKFYEIPKTVDLGMPSGTLWATANLGATTTDEYGEYFAWGETLSKAEYAWREYKYGKSSNSMTKYNADDGLTLLATDDDAAYVILGEDWNIPTSEQMQELIKNCTWTLGSNNGVAGYIVTSNIVGYTDSTIFLPLSGQYKNDANETLGEQAYYWTRNVFVDTRNNKAQGVILTGDEVTVAGSSTNQYRYLGQAIRPVKQLKHYNVTVDASGPGSVSVEPPTTQAFEGRVLTLTATPNEDCYFVKWTDGVTSSTRKITVTEDASYTAVFQSIFSNHEFIDLGLSSGTRWADRNIGTSSPSDWGATFAAAEIMPKSLYTWANYTYYDANAANKGMTKYIGSDYTTIQASDDAAVEHWTASYATPTRNDFQELIDECTWEWTTQDGVNGYKVIGTKKEEGAEDYNYIFLPVTGYNDGDERKESTAAYYMTSEIGTPTADKVTNLYFVEGVKQLQTIERYKGLAVRPVLAQKQYVITLIADPELGKIVVVKADNTEEDVVDGKVIVNAGDDIIFKAIATAEGYEFTEWNTGDTDNPFTLSEIMADEEYEAIFDLKKYIVTANAYVSDVLTPAAADIIIKKNGTTLGTGKKVTHGDVVEVSVTPKEGYEFLSWTVTGTTGEESVEETADGKKVYKYTYTATDNVTIKANLKQNVYTITTVNPTGATLSGGGTFHYGDEVTITLTPAAGYTFSSWTGVDGLGGSSTTDGSNQKYTFTVTGNATISAVMKLNQFNVTAQVNPTAGGSIELNPVGGIYTSGTTVTATLTLNAGYRLDSWTGVAGGTQSGNTYTFTVTAAATITANVSQIQYDATDLLPTYDGPGGEIAVTPKQDHYYYGDDIEVTATITDDCYTFTGWNDGVGHEENPRTFTIEGTKINVKPVFTAPTYPKSIFPTCAAEVGTITLSPNKETYTCGDEVIITFIPAEDAEFITWTDGEKTLSRTVTLGTDELDFKLVATRLVDLGGSVRWSQINIGATSQEEVGDKYRWGATIVGGSGLTTIPPQDVLPAANDAAIANWAGDWRMPTKAEMQELIELCDWSEEPILVNGVPCRKVSHKTKPENFIYLPIGNAHYWTSTYSYTNTVEEQVRIYAYVCNVTSMKVENKSSGNGLFIRPVCPRILPFTITIHVNNDDYGSAVGGVYEPSDLPVTITAIPKEGCVFVHWTDEDGNIVSRDKDLIIKKSLDATYTAHFAKPKLVDLGIGTLWSDINFGACVPEEMGDPYKWGATIFNGSGLMGNSPAVLPAGNDAASVNWGGDWRIPTESEMRRMVEECNWSEVTINGISCYKVSHKTNSDNFIYLPQVVGAVVPSYWTATPIDPTNDASMLYVLRGGVMSSRSRGNPEFIRPVQTIETIVAELNATATEATAAVGTLPSGLTVKVTDADNTEIKAILSGTALHLTDPSQFGCETLTATYYKDGVVAMVQYIQVPFSVVANNTNYHSDCDCDIHIKSGALEISTLGNENKSVTIHDGSLVIKPTGALTLETTIIGATATDDVTIKASAAGTGTLIMKGYTSEAEPSVPLVKATVELFTKYNSKSEVLWNAIGISTTQLDIFSNFPNSWICYLDDISKEWMFIKKGSFKPFTGYIVTQKKTDTRTYYMAGDLVYTADRTFDLAYSPGPVTGVDGEAGDNFFANSWTAPIYISNFVEGDFVGAREATVWKVENGGSYVPYPILESAGDVINPMEAFFVKTDQASGASLKLDYDRLVGATAPAQAKKMAADQDMKQMLNILVNASEVKSDKLRLIQKGNYTAAFDNGADATKMLTDGYPNLSVQSAAKELGVLATNNWDSTLINFRKGDVTTYTLSFEYVGDEELILKDFFTGAQCDITSEITYTFEATDNDMGRFGLFKKPASSDVVTNLQDVWVSDDVLVFSNPAGERTDVTVYTIDGKLIQTITTADTMTEINVPFHGVYLIKLSTATTTKTFKQVF